MKNLLVVALLLLAVFARAANPSFTDFNQSQFNTTGNKISIKAGATVTNVTIINVTTNFLFFSTNFYVQNTIVSNYFTTNVFNDTYASNYFTTNIYQFFTTTNFYMSNIINNDTYISNFYVTNILVDNTYVSNYYTTNLFLSTNVYVTNSFLVGIATNANQFGPSATLTLKDGLMVTNLNTRGGTNFGTAPFQSDAGITTGDGTTYGSVGFLDASTGNFLTETWTNVTFNITNVYVTPWPVGLGWCYQVASSNGFMVRWTNGPCGGGVSLADLVWTNNSGSMAIEALGLSAPTAISFGLNNGAFLNLVNLSLASAGFGVSGNQAVLALQQSDPALVYLTLLDGTQNFGDLPYRFNTGSNLVADASIHTAWGNNNVNKAVLYGNGALSISGSMTMAGGTNSSAVPLESVAGVRTTNVFYLTSSVLGIGGANTNFTVDLGASHDIFIDAGTTNANLFFMNWAAGEARTVNVWFTNRTATPRTVSLSAVTNNICGMGTLQFPLQCTNGIYASFKSMGSSNILVGAQYTALPTN